MSNYFCGSPVTIKGRIPGQIGSDWAIFRNGAFVLFVRPGRNVRRGRHGVPWFGILQAVQINTSNVEVVLQYPNLRLKDHRILPKLNISAKVRIVTSGTALDEYIASSGLTFGDDLMAELSAELDFWLRQSLADLDTDSLYGGGFTFIASSALSRGRTFARGTLVLTALSIEDVEWPRAYLETLTAEDDAEIDRAKNSALMSTLDSTRQLGVNEAKVALEIATAKRMREEFESRNSLADEFARFEQKVREAEKLGIDASAHASPETYRIIQLANSDKVKLDLEARAQLVELIRALTNPGSGALVHALERTPSLQPILQELAKKLSVSLPPAASATNEPIVSEATIGPEALDAQLSEPPCEYTNLPRLRKRVCELTTIKPDQIAGLVGRRDNGTGTAILVLNDNVSGWDELALQRALSEALQVEQVDVLVVPSPSLLLVVKLWLDSLSGAGPFAARCWLGVEPTASGEKLVIRVAAEGGVPETRRVIDLATDPKDPRVTVLADLLPFSGLAVIAEPDLVS